MGTYNRLRIRLCWFKRGISQILMQKPILILLAICSTTISVQFVRQKQVMNDVSISRQKRSLPSPVAFEEINSPSQMMPMSRELHTFYQDSEYEHRYQYYDHRSCVSPEIIDWNSPVSPIYETSSSRYIMPVLIWGPMNQVEGLRETIALAIRLNRTVVIPPMYRHFTDPNGPNGIVDPEIRIDIPSVRKLISTVSYKSLPANLTPDSILIARSLGLEDEHQGGTTGSISGSRASRLRRFETATGFEIANWKSDHDINPEKYFNFPIVPSNSTLESEIRFEFETTDWNNIFGTDSKFSVLLFPYLTARFKPEQGVGKDIMKYTSRPKFLTSMANDFIQANDFPSTFVTLHYRFDKEDWERSCRRTEKTRNMKRNDKRQKICDLLANSTSMGIAEAVASYMVEMFSIKAIGNEIAFYVATPPQQQDMINEMVQQAKIIIKKQLGSSVTVNAKSTIDSARYFDSAYPNCEFVQDNLHEVFSLFEQEICSRGKVFIYAPSSSWSGSIRRERHMFDIQHKLIDHSLLDILENYPKDEKRLIAASQTQQL